MYIGFQTTILIETNKNKEKAQWDKHTYVIHVLPIGMNEKVLDWLIDWLSEWVSEWVTSTTDLDFTVVEANTR